MCECGHHDAVWCATITQDASHSLITVLNAACICPCHKDRRGRVISASEWQKNKEKKRGKRA